MSTIKSVFGREIIDSRGNPTVEATEMCIRDRYKISPLIIVCPRIENSRGINSSPTCKEILSPGDSGIMINVGRYEDYFIKEVIPFIDQTFYTIPTKNGRYLGGISAGGYAALHNSCLLYTSISKIGKDIKQQYL